MTATLKKLQILESLQALDSLQAEKVYDYITKLTSMPKEDAGYQRMKRQAMAEIRQALHNEQKLNRA